MCKTGTGAAVTALAGDSVSMLERSLSDNIGESLIFDICDNNKVYVFCDYARICILMRC